VFAVDANGVSANPIVSYTAPLADTGVAVVGTNLYYHAFTPDTQDTVFAVDLAAATPTPVALAAFPTNAVGLAKVTQLAAANGLVYFSADDGVVGAEPWVTDGTVAGTHLLKDINQDTPTNPGSDPTEFVALGNLVYFAATTIATGREVWQTDGTAAGTIETADVELGDTSSNPTNLLSVGGRLVFTTSNGSGLGATTTLRDFDPQTGLVEGFDGYALNDNAGNNVPFGVYNDVLYMSQSVAGSNVGREPYKLEFIPHPPVITGFSPDTGVVGDGITAANALVVSGTAIPNMRVRLFDGGTTIGSTIADSAGHWSCLTPTLTDGAHVFRAHAVDLNLTESADSNVMTVIVDTVAPAVPTITDFADNSGLTTDNITNDQTVTLSGTTDGDTTVHVFDGPAELGQVAVGADGLWQFTTPALVDGTHTFTARAEDAPGNLSGSSAGFPVVIDATPPVPPSITGFTTDTGVPGDGITSDTTPTLTGTAEPGSVVQVFDGPTALGTTTAGAGGNWQFTTPAQADGPHPFTATATDVAANTSNPSAAFTVTVDTTGPTAAVTPAAGQLDPTNASPITFTVTFSEPVTGFTAAGIDLSASSVGGTLAAQVTGSGTDYVVTVTGMTGDGTVVASVRTSAATDAAGNGNTASAGGSVHFDNVPPAVTIDQAVGQADPTDDTQIQFTVTFSEPVTGFDATDVSFAGSDNPGSLAAAVSGSGADYTVTVTGMSGAQTVVASIPAGAAVDLAGNPSLASTSTDNTVAYNDIGTLQFSVATVPASEGTTAVVTVTRTHGSRGAISVDYATSDGSAHAPGDYAPATGTLNWADGDTTPQTFTVTINSDTLNEGVEFLNLALLNPTGQAIVGTQSTAQVAIAPSNGQQLDATHPSFTVPDADGDLVTVRFGGKVGTATVYLTDGKAPISEIDLAGTDPTKSVLSITVKKPLHGTGDGRVGLGTITGGDLKRLAAPKADLIGAGIQLAGHLLGSVTIGNVLTGAGVVVGGTATNKTSIVAGNFAAGTTIDLGAALTRLSAGTFGGDSIRAASAGTIALRGDLAGAINLTGPALVAGRPVLGTLSVGGSVLPGADITAPSVGAIRVKHDFGSNVAISGTGVLAGKPALGTLAVGGTVRDAFISVAGNITSVTAAGFDGSRLFAGYDGTNFNLPATITTVRVTGKTDAFAGSSLYATNFKSVTLTSVKADNAGTPFGVFAHTSVGRVTVSLPTKRTYPGSGPIGDFDVEVV
jgi:ELWxxDGT repeat protein